MTEYDVVVVGGGPAGVGAAFAAARYGARTLLVERNAVLGGQMTSGLVTGFHGMRVHKGAKEKGEGAYLVEARHTDLVVKGLALEIMDRLAKKGAAHSRLGNPPMRVEFDPEMLIPVLFDMAKEFGLQLLLDSFVFGCDMERHAISDIRIANKSGETRVGAKCFVDASGDGDLAAWAGAPFEKGDEASRRCIPVSVYVVLGNVDLNKTLEYFRKNPSDLHIGDVEKWQELYNQGGPIALMGLRDLIRKAAENGDYPRPLGTTKDITYPIFDIQTSMLPRGTVKLLVDMAYGIDVTNAEDLTRAEVDIRMHQIPGIALFARKYVPGFENSHVLFTSGIMGIRESRRILGQARVTKSDVLSNKSFDHVIARCGRAMNVHSSGGGEQVQLRGGQQWIEAAVPVGFDIPYEALLPQGVDNLVVAGRAISVDRDALGSVRGEPVCMATGEAAGTAAAIAAKLSLAPPSIPIAELQQELLKNNVVL